jgi:hypothetical protein
MDEYLSKPLDLTKLMEAIVRVMNNGRHQSGIKKSFGDQDEQNTQLTTD